MTITVAVLVTLVAGLVVLGAPSDAAVLRVESERVLPHSIASIVNSEGRFHRTRSQDSESAGPSSHVYDWSTTLADDAGVLRVSSGDVLATEAAGPRWGGRMQGDRGAIDFSNGRAGALPDEASVVRGGTNTAERFENGSGVTVDGAGNVNGVSVNSKAGRSVTELSEGIPNGQVGVSTVGDVRAAGGQVTPSPTRTNPFHCTLSGISAEVASSLFTPTIANPCR